MLNETGHLIYADVESEMVKKVNALNKVTRDYAELIGKASEAKSLWKVAFHRSRHMAKVGSEGGKRPSDALAEDIAMDETTDLYTDMLRAEAVADGAKQAMISYRTEIEALRSLMASYRETGG